MPKKNSQTARRASSPSDFKRKTGGVFELPSGLYMRLKNPGGMAALVASGIMPNSLMGIVNQSLTAGQTASEEEIKSLVVTEEGVDAKFLEEMQVLLNTLIVICSVEPDVQPVPEDEADRSDDVVYADEISDEDKMFVFQWVTGGVNDQERFRKEHAKRMAALGSVSEDGGTA